MDKAIIVQVDKSSDGTYWGVTKNIPGSVTSDGATLSELESNLREALDLYLEVSEEEQSEIYEMYKNGFTFEYKISIDTFKDKLPYLNLSVVSERANINASLLRQYVSGKTSYVSKERLKKIEETIHEIGRELMATQL